MKEKEGEREKRVAFDVYYFATLERLHIIYKFVIKCFIIIKSWRSEIK